MPVRDIDRGFKALVQRIYSAGSPSIAVGILSGQGAEAPKTEGDGRASAVNLLFVAICNEFGTARIPARSFIRAWYDESKDRLYKEFGVLMRLVVKGTMSKERALQLMAAKMTGEIQERIALGIEPPNARSTMLRKGSSKPLINTGQLRAGVTSRIKYE